MQLAELADLIAGALAALPENAHPLTGGPLFDVPLVRAVSAEDGIFTEYRKLVGEHHLTPRDVVGLALGADAFTGGTVISLTLPVHRLIRESNHRQAKCTSDIWATYNIRAKGCALALLDKTAGMLNGMSYRTVIPARQQWYKPLRLPGGLSSAWSERHIAYAAGAGTFGLSNGFISEKGVAALYVSLITEMPVTPLTTERKPHMANCLYFSANGACGACLKRCPSGALSATGMDRGKCFEFAYGPASAERARTLGAKGGEVAGCAMCQTCVPCECGVPAGTR